MPNVLMLNVPFPRSGEVSKAGRADSIPLMRRRRPFFFVLFAVVVLLFVALLVTGRVLERWGRVERARKADAILIFGAGVQADGSPSILLRSRTRHAFELWQAGFAPKIVCTGGVGTFSPAESVVQTRLLLGWGVPASAIVREEKSTSTRENALFAAPLLAPRAQVIAVSDPFHLWRCRRDSERAGLRATTSPALSGWDTLSPYLRLFLSLREAALVARDTLLG